MPETKAEPLTLRDLWAESGADLDKYRELLRDAIHKDGVTALPVMETKLFLVLAADIDARGMLPDAFAILSPAGKRHLWNTYRALRELLMGGAV